MHEGEIVRRQSSLRIALASLVMVTTLGAASPLTLAETLDQTKSSYSEKQNSLKNTREKLQQNKVQQNDLMSQIGASDKRLVDLGAETLRLCRELDATVEKRTEAERQLGDVQVALAETTKQLAKTKATLAESKRTLNARLTSVYKSGKESYLSLIFGSKDFPDLLNRLSFLKMLADRDSQIVKTTEVARDKIKAEESEERSKETLIATKRAAILAEEKRIGLLKAEQEKREAAERRERDQRQQLADKLKNDQATLEKMEAQEEEDAKALAERIKSWSEPAPAQQNAVENASAQPAIPVSSTGWVWPAGSTADVTSPFGYRIHPITGEYKLHTGVDIAVDYGTPVVAANSGVVRYAAYCGGYGLHVEIEHANGMASTYSHLSAVAVDMDQTVKAGDVIGYVGSTGNSTGPHLHFEILEDGAFQNPLNWY